MRHMLWHIDVGWVNFRYLIPLWSLIVKKIVILALAISFISISHKAATRLKKICSFNVIGLERVYSHIKCINNTNEIGNRVNFADTQYNLLESHSARIKEVRKMWEISNLWRLNKTFTLRNHFRSVLKDSSPRSHKKKGTRYSIEKTFCLVATFYKLQTPMMCWVGWHP